MSVALLQPGATMASTVFITPEGWEVSVIHAATWIHRVNVFGPYYHWRQNWFVWPLLPPRPCLYVWLVLLPKVMVISEVHCATEGQVGVLSPSFCFWGPFGYPWLMLSPKALWMSIVCDAFWNHGDVCGLCCCQGLCWSLWPMLSPKAMGMFVVCVDVLGLFYSQRPCGSLWPMLSLTLKG